MCKNQDWKWYGEKIFLVSWIANASSLLSQKIKWLTLVLLMLDNFRGNGWRIHRRPRVFTLKENCDGSHLCIWVEHYVRVLYTTGRAILYVCVTCNNLHSFSRTSSLALYTSWCSLFIHLPFQSLISIHLTLTVVIISFMALTSIT